VRAGALSLKALKEKLGGIVSDHEVEEAVSLLARSEVRLITQVQEKNVTLYELADERIIAPLHFASSKVRIPPTTVGGLFDGNLWTGSQQLVNPTHGSWWIVHIPPWFLGSK